MPNLYPDIPGCFSNNLCHFLTANVRKRTEMKVLRIHFVTERSLDSVVLLFSLNILFYMIMQPLGFF